MFSNAVHDSGSCKMKSKCHIIYTYMHIYIPWIHKFVIARTGHGISHHRCLGLHSAFGWTAYGMDNCLHVRKVDLLNYSAPVPEVEVTCLQLVVDGRVMMIWFQLWHSRFWCWRALKFLRTVLFNCNIGTGEKWLRSAHYMTIVVMDICNSYKLFNYNQLESVFIFLTIKFFNKW